MNRLKLVLLLVGALVVSSGAFAAPSGDVEITRSEIQLERKDIVDSNMDLDEETARKFWPLYNDYQEALRGTRDEVTSLLQDYAMDWTALPDEKAKALLDRMIKAQGEYIKVKKTFVSKFRKSLPPKVVARFFQIENKLDAIVSYELAAQVPLVH